MDQLSPSIVAAISQVDTSYYYRLQYEPEANAARLKYDHGRMPDPGTFEKYWKDRRIPNLDPELFKKYPQVWLEIGAGSGTFATALGKLYPDSLGIALERSRMRGKRLEKRVERLGTDNVIGLRGNVIPTFIRDIPPGTLDRVYCLYPCPWPKNGQRKNRWYLHPIMPHIVKSLKPGGLLIWASDQQFYIDEAKWVSEHVYGLKTLVHGPLAPNAYNDFDKFPQGRSTFESGFLARGHVCHELISQAPISPA